MPADQPRQGDQKNKGFRGFRGFLPYLSEKFADIPCQSRLLTPFAECRE
jgi:hypothetical protein